MISEDIHRVLRDYYHWARINAPEDIGYPHSIPTERLRRSVVGSAGISDDEAQYINIALCILKAEHPDQYKVVERVYRDGKTIRWMWDNGEGARPTLSKSLSNGMQFLRGVLVGARLSS